jgi:hypothetical protein
MIPLVVAGGLYMGSSSSDFTWVPYWAKPVIGPPIIGVILRFF